MIPLQQIFNSLSHNDKANIVELVQDNLGQKLGDTLSDLFVALKYTFLSEKTGD